MTRLEHYSNLILNRYGRSLPDGSDWRVELQRLLDEVSVSVDDRNKALALLSTHKQS